MTESIVILNLYNPGLLNPVSTKYISMEELNNIEDLCIPDGTRIASIRKGVLHIIAYEKEEKHEIPRNVSTALTFLCKPIHHLKAPYLCGLVINLNLEPYY